MYTFPPIFLATVFCFLKELLFQGSSSLLWELVRSQNFFFLPRFFFFLFNLFPPDCLCLRHSKNRLINRFYQSFSLLFLGSWLTRKCCSWAVACQQFSADSSWAWLPIYWVACFVWGLEMATCPWLDSPGKWLVRRKSTGGPCEESGVGLWASCAGRGSERSTPVLSPSPPGLTRGCTGKNFPIVPLGFFNQSAAPENWCLHSVASGMRVASSIIATFPYVELTSVYVEIKRKKAWQCFWPGVSWCWRSGSGGGEGEKERRLPVMCVSPVIWRGRAHLCLLDSRSALAFFFCSLLPFSPNSVLLSHILD